MGVSDQVLQNWIFKFQNFTATMSNIWPKSHVQLELALNLILNKPKKSKIEFWVYPIRHYCYAFLMGAIMTTKFRVAVVKWTCNCSFFQIWRGPNTTTLHMYYGDIFFLYSSQLIFTKKFSLIYLLHILTRIFLTKTSSIDHKHVLLYAFVWYIFFSTIKNLRQCFCFSL